ncbi:MAG: alpha/beta hydrolase [Chloroflexi bacterium]|nr:alpha/beta hydrolase [Chloroflexota bacterium]
MPERGPDTSSIVFIHGSGGNGAQWAYQSRYFSKRYNVVALDLPGHGRNRGETLKEIGDMAGYVLSEIERLQLNRPALVGHSLGGAVALQAALDRPPALGSLVLVGTGARLRVLPSFLESILTDHDKALGDMAGYIFSRNAPEPIVDKAMSESRKVPARVLYDDLAACDRFDVMQRLGEIRLPTLIVVGRDDFMTPVKYSEYLKANIPGSHLEIIEGAGHMVMLEQVDRFDSVLDTFLSATSGGG